MVMGWPWARFAPMELQQWPLGRSQQRPTPALPPQPVAQLSTSGSGGAPAAQDLGRGQSWGQSQSLGSPHL